MERYVKEGRGLKPLFRKLFDIKNTNYFLNLNHENCAKCLIIFYSFARTNSYFIPILLVFLISYYTQRLFVRVNGKIECKFSIMLF